MTKAFSYGYRGYYDHLSRVAIQNSATFLHKFPTSRLLIRRVVKPGGFQTRGRASKSCYSQPT